MIRFSSTPLRPNEVAIARDALVIIVSRNCKLKAVTRSHHRYAVTKEQITQLFTANQGDAPDGITNAHAYTFTKDNSSRDYMERNVMASVKVREPILEDYDDWKMVNDVAADPYGIGYCSSAAADPKRVRILDIITSDGKVKHFDADDYKYPQAKPSSKSDAAYPYIRTIKVKYAPGGEAAEFIRIFKDPIFRAGPLYKTGYFLPITQTG